MEWMQHLFHNDHGEWSLLLTAFGAGGVLSDIVYRVRHFFRPKPRYRVVRQKVTGGYTPKVEEIVYGPYRWFFQAFLVAHLVCGEWDSVTVEEKKP